jgi:urease accessory protein
VQLIHDHLPAAERMLPQIALRVDRLTLAKRRWRGTAEDGSEFGFDLQRPLANGDVFAATSAAVYRIAQAAEPVLEVALSADSPGSARLGWVIGNLHFPLEIDGEVLRVADDPALRQLFTRETIAFTAREAIFTPLSGGHHH